MPDIVQGWGLEKENKIPMCLPLLFLESSGVEGGESIYEIIFKTLCASEI